MKSMDDFREKKNPIWFSDTIIKHSERGTNNLGFGSTSPNTVEGVNILLSHPVKVIEHQCTREPYLITDFCWGGGRRYKRISTKILLPIILKINRNFLTSSLEFFRFASKVLIKLSQYQKKRLNREH